MPESIRGPHEAPKHEAPLMGPHSEQHKVFDAMKTPVHSLGELKKVLISNLGEKKGMKLYNHFLTSIVSAMLSQIRQTSQSADQATKEMGQNR